MTILHTVLLVDTCGQSQVTSGLFRAEPLVDTDAEGGGEGRLLKRRELG
jgi:hypothetical protein